MKTALGILSLLFFSLTTMAETRTADELSQLLKTGQIYFLPDTWGSENWNGEVYWYKTKTCNMVFQKDSPIVDVTTRQCSQIILTKAFLKPVKVTSFPVFRTKVLGCLSEKSCDCLQKYLSPKIQVAAETRGLGDRRQYACELWKDDELSLMKSLIEKGTADLGQEKIFPPEASKGKVTPRGTFQKESGGWKLMSFLAED